MKKQVKWLWCMMVFGYLLGIRGDRIALWREDDPQPIHIFPYSVSALPQQEQQRLRSGIRADNALELTKLLEAYLP